MDPSIFGSALHIPANDEPFVPVSLVFELLTDLVFHVGCETIARARGLLVIVGLSCCRDEMHDDVMFPLAFEHWQHYLLNQTKVFGEVRLVMLNQVG